jgi:sarcosine oxidase subunit alpha
MTSPAAALPAAGCLTDPARPLTFSFEGRDIPAVHGQSIAAALYAAGQRVFSRSFKYHRPRGFFCVSGDCPNCLMQVDGRPNVRTCIEPARQGQVVCHQNAWPSLSWDLLRVFDRFSRFLPVGFYYKRFHKPRWLWPIFERVVRHIAGLGRIDPHTTPHAEAEIEHLHTEVCVVGAGPAGLAAAAQAASAGAGVLVCERLPRLGGHLLYRNDPNGELENLLAAVRSQPRVRVLCDTAAFGLYEGNLLGAVQKQRFLRIRARQVVVCTGGRQQPFIFHNNDLPGIALADGVLRLARLHGVRAGQRAVILTDNDQGQPIAAQVAELGMEVVAVVDVRPGMESRSEGPWPVLSSHTVLRGRGGSRLKAVRIARMDGNGTAEPATEREIACDLLCMASQPAPANELLAQGGVRFRHEGGCWRPDGTVPGLSAAGGAAGTFGLSAQIDEGRRRGAEAALALGYAAAVPGPAEPERTSSCASSLFLPQPHARDHKRFLCLCEDVTEKDLVQAVAEGFDHVETLKRYATVNMGPCQGKVCGLAAATACARLTGRDVGAVGSTTSRPPAVPVELCVLAAGRHEPVRRTPLHHWHEAAGAHWLDAGLWKRPEHYGDVAAEVRAVRTAAGLIDVSTLGKIELIGPGAAELLERVYLNRWADLPAGRARYGAMCNEDGILFDDGVGARLGPEHYYLTATTGNADAVVQWLELWKANWRIDVLVLNRTSAVAAMNLAGPQARNVLAGLTGLDVSDGAFPYMAVREAEVAGVPCRLLRIGFVGELGYEIHCPASHAWHVWEALAAAGQAFGLRPFGVEAQRVLRLEKGHLIIGQDSDALSNPLEAGLGWMVRFEKPAFHGRGPLLRLKEMGPRSRLVGFHLAEERGSPAEGNQVVERGRPVGRVTSVRYSPTLQRHLGLAWIPVAAAKPGARFLVRHGGGDLAAVVAELPFYDPQGKRLKS